MNSETSVSLLIVSLCLKLTNLSCGLLLKVRLLFFFPLPPHSTPHLLVLTKDRTRIIELLLFFVD